MTTFHFHDLASLVLHSHRGDKEIQEVTDNLANPERLSCNAALFDQKGFDLYLYLFIYAPIQHITAYWVIVSLPNWLNIPL